jgi:hypothetical protein
MFIIGKLDNVFALCWKVETFSVEKKVAGDVNCLFQSPAILILLGDGQSVRSVLRQINYDSGTGNNMTCPPGNALCVQKFSAIC